MILYIYKPHGTSYSISSTCYAMTYFLQYILRGSNRVEYLITLHCYQLLRMYYLTYYYTTSFKNYYNVIPFYLYIIIFVSIRMQKKKEYKKRQKEKRSLLFNSPKVPNSPNARCEYDHNNRLIYQNSCHEAEKVIKLKLFVKIEEMIY